MPAATHNTMWNKSTIGLMTGTVFAGFGAWIDFLAILTLASYGYNANAFLMAFISALFVVPSMLFSTTVGRWLDRGGVENYFTISLIFRCIATACLLLHPSVELFCVFVALRSCFTVPTDISANVMVSQLVERNDAPRYFGILGLFRNASKIAAPTIGAGIASQFGESQAILLSIAITLLGVFAFAIGLHGRQLAAKVEQPSAAQPTGKSASAETSVGGLGTLLPQLICTVTVFVFMVFFVNNQMPVLLREAGFDKALVGILISCSGAGGILTATYMSRRKAGVVLSDPMKPTTLAVLATAACFVLLGFAFTLPKEYAPFAAGALFFCTGICATVEAIRANTVVVQHFPGAVGVVSAKIQAYQSTAMLLAPWAAAILVPYVSMQMLFILDGSLAFGAVVLMTAWFYRISMRARLSSGVV